MPNSSFKRSTIILFLLVFNATGLFSSNNVKDKTDTSQKVLPTYKPISVEPVFKDGEELVFVLHYGFINGGRATLTVTQTNTGGRNVFHTVAKAKTTGLTDKIFRVVDVYESYFDISSNLPMMALRNISEGNYKKYDEVWFNNTDHKVKNTKGEFKVPENTLDMLGGLFYIRRIDFTNFKPGDIVSVITWFDDRVFPFYIVFKGRETVSNGMGKFKCLKFVPVVEPGRIFKENDDMTIWLSDDANKLPIQIRFDMLVGSFKCDIESYKNLKYPLNSAVK